MNKFIFDRLFCYGDIKGFACLMELLTDLETAQQSRNFGIASERFERRKDGVSNVVYCNSPFEEQVVEFLENEGYEIECLPRLLHKHTEPYDKHITSAHLLVKQKWSNNLAATTGSVWRW
jgi:hypothetical protein